MKASWKRGAEDGHCPVGFGGRVCCIKMKNQSKRTISSPQRKLGRLALREFEFQKCKVILYKEQYVQVTHSSRRVSLNKLSCEDSLFAPSSLLEIPPFLICLHYISRNSLGNSVYSTTLTHELTKCQEVL